MICRSPLSHCRRKGITLVELVVAMVILSAIATVGGRAFFQVMQVSREVRAQARASEDEWSVVEDVRRTLSSVAREGFGAYSPYSESQDPETRDISFSILTRSQEPIGESLGGDLSQYMVISYSLVQRDDHDGFKLRVSKRSINPGSPPRECTEGFLCDNLRSFSLSPVYVDDTEQDGQGTSQVRKALAGIELRFSANAKNARRSDISLFVPAETRPRQRNAERSKSDAR